MSEPIEKLRELVKNWKENQVKYGCTIHMGVDELEALLAALEQREQELREALAGLLNDPYWQKRIASVEQGFGTATEYGKIVERARAALNPTEPKRVTP